MANPLIGGGFPGYGGGYGGGMWTPPPGTTGAGSFQDPYVFPPGTPGYGGGGMYDLPVIGGQDPIIQPPVGGVQIPGVPAGVGICPPGTQCLGFSPLGFCIGGCTALGVGGGDTGGLGFDGPPDTPPVTANGPQAMIPVNGCCPAGSHKNKSAYWRRENGTWVYVLPGTRCVRNRRRNPLNPRAADRAIGRLRSASRFGKYLAKIDLPAKGTKRR